MNRAFYTGALGAMSSSSKMDVVANNLANINTTAFKPKTAVFSDLINSNLNDSEDAVTELQTGNGVKVARTYTSFDASGVTQTGSEFDYAILDNNSFFMVQDPATGAVSYTRDGHFHRALMDDDTYYLMTDAGKYVLDQNQEPIVLEVVDVEELQNEMEDGYEPETDDTTDEEDEDAPRVSVYTFANPSRLLSVGDNEYVPRDNGAEAVLVQQPGLMQGALETSGTDLTKELTRMIECQRAFSYALKMVTTSDEIESTINGLRG